MTNKHRVSVCVEELCGKHYFWAAGWDCLQKQKREPQVMSSDMMKLTTSLNLKPSNVTIWELGTYKGCRKDT